MIEVKDLTFTYQKNQGIQNISFLVQPEESAVLLGSEGAGKTTILRTLMGFLKPERGYARLADTDSFRFSGKAHQNVGYLAQESAFFPQSKGTSYLRFCAAYKGVKDKNRIRELLGKFELDATDRISRMSLSERTKLGLVDALLADPQILILDEPTSGLEPAFLNRLVRYLKEEKQKGKCILMASSDFAFSRQLADFAILMKEGNIVSQVDIADLEKQQTRTYEIEFETEGQLRDFCQEDWPVANITRRKLSVTLSGSPARFLAALSKYSILTLSSKPASLEDLFAQYFRKETVL
ncbi:MAG: ABC transporter ATP-binding protein [Erysipelotrichaceae bacterium]|jgi:ABC-2 type transport system ATP-binding protein|nr:ABC transporter ATP-binding protein [Erysipelotrichaceae bacterium]